MKHIFVLLFCLLVVSTAFGFDEDQPNTIGLYFDDQAERYCIANVPAPAIGTVHLFLTNPTFEAVYGFECKIDILGPGDEPGEAEFYNPVVYGSQSYINVAGGPGHFIVGFGSPLVCTELTFLCSLDIHYTGYGSMVRLMLGGSTPSSGENPESPYVLITGNELVEMTVTTPYGDACAVINAGDCSNVVATESTTFELLKSLYR